jgi:hypothetical protein
MSEPWRLLPEGRDVEVLLVLLADPVGSLEVGEHKEVKEFGASGRREGLETSWPEVPPSLHLLEGHGRQSPDNGPDRKREADHDRRCRQGEEDLPPVRFDRRWSRCDDRVLEPIERHHARRIGLPSPWW